MRIYGCSPGSNKINMGVIILFDAHGWQIDVNYIREYKHIYIIDIFRRYDDCILWKCDCNYITLWQGDNKPSKRSLNTKYKR